MMPPGYTIRRASNKDLHAIIVLLSADSLGQGRENASLPLQQSYLDAFAAIEADPNQFLAVVVKSNNNDNNNDDNKDNNANNNENDNNENNNNDGEKVVGTVQLTFIPNISRQGAWRAQIEAVRIDSNTRGSGLGHKMIEWCIEQSRIRGCSLIQLSCDHSRPDAHRFYESLGFVGSHTGFKKFI